MGKGSPPGSSEKEVDADPEKEVDAADAALMVGSGPPPYLPIKPKDSDKAPLNTIAEGCFTAAQNTQNEAMKAAYKEAGDTLVNPKSSPEDLNRVAGQLGTSLKGLSSMLEHVNQLPEGAGKALENVANGVEANPITNMAVSTIAGTVGFDSEDLTGAAEGMGIAAQGAAKIAGGALDKDASTKEAFSDLAEGAKGFSGVASKTAGKLTDKVAGFAADKIVTYVTKAACTGVGGAIGACFAGVGAAPGAAIGGVVGEVASNITGAAAGAVVGSVAGGVVEQGSKMAIDTGADVTANVAGTATDAVKSGAMGAVESVVGIENPPAEDGMPSPPPPPGAASPEEGSLPNPLDIISGGSPGEEGGMPDPIKMVTDTLGGVMGADGGEGGMPDPIGMVTEAVGGIFGAEQSENNAPDNAAGADPISMVTDVISNLTGGGKEGGSPLDMVSGLIGGIAEKITSIAPDITEVAKLK